MLTRVKKVCALCALPVHLSNRFPCCHLPAYISTITTITFTVDVLHISGGALRACLRCPFICFYLLHMFSRKRSEGFSFSVLGECEGRQSAPEPAEKPRRSAESRRKPPKAAAIRGDPPIGSYLCGFAGSGGPVEQFCSGKRPGSCLRRPPGRLIPKRA